MMWEVYPDGAQWSLRRTPAGRVGAAIGWGVAGIGISAIGSALFFGIDFVGRAASGVDVPPTFLLTVGSFALFGGFFAFVARMLRFRHWVIDRDGRTLALSLRRAFGDPDVHEVSFDEIRTVSLQVRGLGARSEVVVDFTDGARDVLAWTRLGARGFDGVLLGLRRALDETGVPIDANGQE